MFMYHECQLVEVSVCFKADVLLSSIDDTITDTQKSLGDEHSAPSVGVFIVSVPLAAGDHEGTCGFWDMPMAPSIKHVKRLVMLNNIQGLVRCASLPVVGSGLISFALPITGFVTILH